MLKFYQMVKFITLNLLGMKSLGIKLSVKKTFLSNIKNFKKAILCYLVTLTFMQIC